MALRIAIVGAGGRMGRQLIQAVHNAEGVELGAAFERVGSSYDKVINDILNKEYPQEAVNTDNTKTEEKK